MASPAPSPSHPTTAKPSAPQDDSSAPLLTSFAVSEADGRSSLCLNDLLVLADDSRALDKLGGDYGRAYELGTLVPLSPAQASIVQSTSASMLSAGSAGRPQSPPPLVQQRP